MKHVIIIYATVLVCAQSSFTPQEVMVDVTNDFGVCILQLVSSRRENIAFSPYGVVSVGLVLYEGASGTTAAEIHNTLRLPWDRHITRIGFRDLHRYLKSYFTNDGFLRGLVLSKPNVILHWNYTRQLQFYGFDLKPADTPTKIPSTAQTTPMGQTTKPSLTTEATPVQSQQPTTSVTMQQGTEEPVTENANKPPTTTQSTNAATTVSETSQTEGMSKVPTASPPSENTVTTKPDTQETEITTNAPLTTPTTAKAETANEATQQTEEVSIGITPSSSTSGSITSNGDDQQTEEITISPITNAIPTNSETQQTEEAPKITPTTDTVNTQNEETKTTPNVQPTISPEAETRTTNGISETSKAETTMAVTDETKVEMEGRVDSDESSDSSMDSSMESNPQTEVPTTEGTEKTEIASVSTIMTSIPQTVSEKGTTATSTTVPETTKTDKAESETTIMSTTSQTTQFSASSDSEGTTKEATEAGAASTASALSETTNIEKQSPTEPMTTMPQSSPTETMTTTIASTISYPMNEETETTNEINTQQSTSETGTTPNDEGISRKRRALAHSKRIAPEHREGVSNWVPHYQDPRWNYHAPLESWFFSYFGGEKVPIITYSAYLPFAYLGDLATLALQLPLDDPRYYMLILLPQERNGLEKLLYSLQWCPIRGIINQLKLTAVYATVPVFTIVKHVNLVPALAKLGILSVFDPSTADLSAMSPEKGIFVRTIEQVVTVSLRKYFANYRWFEAKPSEVEQHFIANHPFAYFVLDKETQVTLMTGTIVNPTAYNQ